MFNEMDVIVDDVTKHCYHGGHPINRLSQEKRDRVGKHLDLILIPNPCASDGVNICSIFNSDIKTYRKMVDLIRGKRDGICWDGDGNINKTIMKVFINDIIRRRRCRISFKKTGHIACPVWKCCIRSTTWKTERVVLKSVGGNGGRQEKRNLKWLRIDFRG